MELVSTADFEAWAAAHGIGRNPAYPYSPSLAFAGEEATWYRYRRPGTERMATFAERAVRVAAWGGGAWLHPPARGGAWGLGEIEHWPPLAHLRAAIRGAGIPDGYAGAIRCAADEVALAARLMAAALEHADCFWELAIVPLHARCVLASAEDGDLIGSFPSEGGRASYTAAVRQAGWTEPEEPDPRVSATDPWLEL